MDLQNCKICPRECGIDRYKYKGFCGGTATVKVARAALHYYEEPCISGESGSGTVFFSGCPLKCVFCQNKDISAGNFGKEITVERLAEIFLELQEKGANNINLVTPTHYALQISDALDIVKDKLHIPVVYNTSGYENLQTLRLLDGKIDIYLTDLKYMSSSLSKELSKAENYYEKTIEAIKEMVRQRGPYAFDENDMLKSGVIVRHLIIPQNTRDSLDIIDELEETFLSDEILLSVMSQYTPNFYDGDIEFLHRTLEPWEVDRVMERVENSIFDGYCQDLSSATDEYTPCFDLEGI